jgi:hypothetical protein
VCDKRGSPLPSLFFFHTSPVATKDSEENESRCRYNESTTSTLVYLCFRKDFDSVPPLFLLCSFPGTCLICPKTVFCTCRVSLYIMDLHPDGLILGIRQSKIEDVLHHKW